MYDGLLALGASLIVLGLMGAVDNAGRGRFWRHFDTTLMWMSFGDALLGAGLTGSHWRLGLYVMIGAVALMLLALPFAWRSGRQRDRTPPRRRR